MVNYINDGFSSWLRVRSVVNIFKPILENFSVFHVREITILFFNAL